MRTLPFFTGCAAAAFLALFAAGAQAQEDVPLEHFSASRFTPAIGPGNYFGVDGSTISPHLMPAAGLTLDYSHRPFRLYSARCTDAEETDCEVTDTEADIVAYSFSAHLWGAIGIADRVQIGLGLPIVFVGGEGFSYSGGGGDPVILNGGTGREWSTGALGDLRLSVKGQILRPGRDQAIGFAAVLYGTVPMAEITAEGRYVGEDTVTVGGHFIGEFVHDQIRITANAGVLYRPTRTLFSTQTGAEMTYGLAAGYQITPLIGIFGELQGGTSLSAQIDENPLEGRLGGRIRAGDLEFSLGFGAGLLSGVGVPQFRGLGQAAYVPIREDGDGDGVLDANDGCPSEREDADGYEDTDGCPEADNDGDAIADDQDRCPDEAEDRDNEQDEDGCPETDDDGDGIQDGYDSCPQQAEDMDGDRDDDGCPDNDRDQDGANDDVDQCPDQPEDTDGFGDDDGCPEEDFDGDGVNDDRDECPDQAENVNGNADTDGCPEAEEAAPPPPPEPPPPEPTGRRRRRGQQ